MYAATITNISSRAIVGFCASRGVPSERLLAAAGIPAEQISGPRARISAERVFALWEEGQKATHDALIAEHVAGFVPFGAYTIGDSLLAAGPTPRQALQKLIRTFPLVNGAFELQLTRQGAESGLELRNPYDPKGPSRLYVEFFFALILSRLRYATGVDSRPKEIWFTHPATLQSSDCHPMFQCRVLFNQPLNQMVLETEFLDSPLPYADPLLSEMLEHYAQRLLKESLSQDHLIRDLHQALHEGLWSGDLRLTTIAKKLALGGRSLQRELTSRGTSYREEIDRLRRDLTLAMLPHQPIQEIVAFLRFSESSSFYRAFRRWTGKTPHEFLNTPGS